MEWAQRQDATQADRVVASCMFAYSSMLKMISKSHHILSDEEARQFFTFTIKHLQCYRWLHAYGREVALNQPGRHSWLLLPKLHHMWHLAHDTLKVRVNPGMVMLLSAESFVGVMGRIGPGNAPINSIGQNIREVSCKTSLSARRCQCG